MKKIISLLLLYLMIITQCFSATGIPDSRTWVNAGFGGGGSYSIVLPDNTTANKLYLASDVNDPWVSTDGTDTWTQMANAGYTNTYTAFLAQSPSDPNTIWSIGLTSVALTKDGGATWNKKASYRVFNRGGQYIAIDPTNDDHVFVAASGNVYETTDEGLTWSTAASLPFDSRAAVYTTQSACSAAGASWSTTLSKCVIVATFVYFDQPNNVLIIGSGSGGFPSSSWGMVKYNLTDDTQSYIDLTGTNAKRNFYFDTYTDGATKYFCTTAGQKIACTSDYSTWTYTANTTSDSTYYVEHFVISKLSGGTVRIISDRRRNDSSYLRVIQRSVDAGSTWTTVTNTLASTSVNPTNAWAGGSGNNSFSITKDPFNENIYYRTSDWRVFKSTDGGATFVEKVSGAQNVVVSDIDIAPNGRIFASMMDDGIVYSDNHGSTWTSVFPNSTYPFSTWGGHTWRILCIGTEAEWNAGTGVVVATHTTYQAGKYYWTYILRSTNSGATFTPNLIVNKDLYNGIWSNGYPRGLAMSADQNTIYFSLDGDNCQYDTALPATCPSTGNPTPSNWITGGIFISRDKGATWARSNGNSRITTLYPARRVYNGLAVDPSVSSGNTVLLGAFSHNVYRSTTAGATDGGWGYSLATDYVYDLRFGSDNVPVLVGTEGNNPVVYRAIVTGFGNATGGYGTWQKMTTFSNTGIADGLEIDPVNPNRIFVSTTLGADVKGNRKVYVTADAQNGNVASWVDITGNMPINGCQDIEIDYTEGTQGYVYCALNGGGIVKMDLADTPASTPGQTRIGS